MQISCKKCGYSWEYAGRSHRTSCSKCRTSITIHRLGTIGLKDVVITLPKIPDATIVKFPYALWKDARFTQRMQNLKSLGEDYITLKANSEGILSL